jgi:hypothetical protein
MKCIMHMAVGFVLALSTGWLASPAAAQTSAPAPDQSSLGDYARKVVHKDPAAAKARPKVYDNDNLPVDDKLSVVGPPPTTEASAAAPADAGKDKDKDPSGTKPAGTADEEQAKKQALWKDWQSKLGAQKDQIDLSGRELDVLQREYQLRAAEEYADAGNRLRNSAQWDKDDADYKQKITDKQKAVDDAKQKLVDMQEQARKAGVPSSMIE